MFLNIKAYRPERLFNDKQWAVEYLSDRYDFRQRSVSHWSERTRNTVLFLLLEHGVEDWAVKYCLRDRHLEFIYGLFKDHGLTVERLEEWLLHGNENDVDLIKDLKLLVKKYRVNESLAVSWEQGRTITAAIGLAEEYGNKGIVERMSADAGIQDAWSLVADHMIDKATVVRWAEKGLVSKAKYIIDNTALYSEDITVWEHDDTVQHMYTVLTVYDFNSDIVSGWQDESTSAHAVALIEKWSVAADLVALCQEDRTIHNALTLLEKYGFTADLLHRWTRESSVNDALALIEQHGFAPATVKAWKDERTIELAAVLTEVPGLDLAVVKRWRKELTIHDAFVLTQQILLPARVVNTWRHERTVAVAKQYLNGLRNDIEDFERLSEEDILALGPA